MDTHDVDAGNGRKRGTWERNVTIKDVSVIGNRHLRGSTLLLRMSEVAICHGVPHVTPTSQKYNELYRTGDWMERFSFTNLKIIWWKNAWMKKNI